MNKDLQYYIIEKTNEMISYYFCCSEVRAEAEKWLDPIGIGKEQR